MQIGFDNEKYVRIQAERIRDRVSNFGGKLYLEFGGKLFDDYHATRVLPGFEADAKLRVLTQLAEDAEILLVTNANDIEGGKRRSDIGITYDDDVLRLLDAYHERGFLAKSIVITHYTGQSHADAFQKKLESMGVTVYHHYLIDGYPSDMSYVVSDEGFGKNDFVKTSRPIVAVTAPGPGSGKLATCLSQLYHEHLHGVNAGYAKFETFPVWNLPLAHPVNIAYEAATADLNDRNVIDPFHLDNYGQITVNYNRDVETFPVLKAMLDQILGESPYRSPTDMGVNMVGYCINDDEVCCAAAKHEIVRRYFNTAEQVRRTGMGRDALANLELLMSKADITVDYDPAHRACLDREENSGLPAGAMTLPNKQVMTGKRGDLLDPAASLLLNSLKNLAGVPDETYVVSDEALAPIRALKKDYLHSSNTLLSAGEMLIALSSSSPSNPLAAKTIAAADDLKGLTAYFSVIISAADEATYRQLGINVCCEPKFEHHMYYHN